MTPPLNSRQELLSALINQLQRHKLEFSGVELVKEPVANMHTVIHSFFKNFVIRLRLCSYAGELDLLEI